MITKSSKYLKAIEISTFLLLSRITNLIMCPKDDKFISTSQDNTLRLWDLNENSKDCLCVLDVQKENLSAYPVASFDPAGVIFGVAWS